MKYHKKCNVGSLSGSCVILYEIDKPNEIFIAQIFDKQLLWDIYCQDAFLCMNNNYYIQYSGGIIVPDLIKKTTTDTLFEDVFDINK